MDSITKRHEKVAFMALADTPDKFIRMRGFTEFSLSKNPEEYQRRYVDEKTQRNDVVAYSPTISYSFDRFSEDPVHKELVAIFDNETVGTDAVRKIVIVDLSETDNENNALCREWTVIPDSEGDDIDAYTYSGTLKSNGENVIGKAVSDDDWLTCTFSAE